jgi:uncharacterized membrane protein
MSEAKEKDNFLLYVLLAGAVAGGAVYMVKSAEHDKYASAQKAISEDASNSAYRNDVLHSGGSKK